jgi:hypothetical protein
MLLAFGAVMLVLLAAVMFAKLETARHTRNMSASVAAPQERALLPGTRHRR